MDLNDYLSVTAPVKPSAAALPEPPAIDQVWPEIQPVEYLPNGQPLRCTLRRTLIMADVFGAPAAPFPALLSVVFLYLCAHPAAEWSGPVTLEPGDVRPLWRAPEQLLETALLWGEREMVALQPQEVANLASRLWLWHDATRVTPQKKSPPAAMPPPASSPPEKTSGSTSSVEETPPGTAGS